MDLFKRMYGEALISFTEFQAYTLFVFTECSEDAEFSSIKASFGLADQHYKEMTRICNHLALWHAAKVESKHFRDWTIKEREEDVLVRSLLKATSVLMSSLLDVYGPWLRKGQGNDVETAPPKE
ncbi:MAG TPA: hypothetical protein VMR99_02435 [Candidatus Paceibacterota bacterium]|nr:hypothetical protein [Candidatus Paceibacterota bacterium]